MFDELGRPIEESAPDGTVTTTEYDQVAPGDGAHGSRLPIGLPVLQTVTGVDGAMQQTEHRLNDARTAVIESETRTQVPGHALMTSGLAQYDVDANGFVTAQRTYPGGDRGAEPVVTAWSEVTDLPAGTVTSTATVGVGTPGEATTQQTTSLSHGGVMRQVDAVGNVSGATYDALGRPVTQTDASGLVTRTSFETAQQQGRNATTVTTPDEVVTTEERDALGRVTRTLDNIDHDVPVEGHVRVAEARHYPVDRPGTIEITDAWGAMTTIRQDAFGRETAATGPNGLTKLSIYDDVANTVTTALTPTGDPADAELVNTAQLDDAGRVVHTTGARDDGAPVAESAATFDGLGRELTATDGTMHSSARYDEAGNPVERTLSAAGATTPMLTAERRFDTAGATVEKTLRDDRNARPGIEQHADALGRVVSFVDQSKRVGTVAYSPDGLPTREVATSGQVTEIEYDQHTRRPVRTTVSSQAGDSVTTQADLDPVTGAVTSLFDPNDRAATEISYDYDAFGNTTSVRYPDGVTVSREYDAHGRRRSVTDHTGAVTRYEYDAAGLIASATQFADETPQSAVLAGVQYRYDAFGRVSRLERDTGVITEYRYTSASQIAAESTTDPGGATLSARDYAYDRTGTLIERVDRVREADTGALAITTTRYRYDAMSRLTGSTVHDGEGDEASAARTTEYDLLVSGDIERETVTEHPGGADEVVTVREFEYTALGELTAITTNGDRREQTYDVAGNLTTTADGTEYRFDALNRPVATITTEGETSFDYWADGTRRSSSGVDPATGAVQRDELYWDGSSVVSERHTGADEGSASPATGDVTYLIGATRHARTVLGGVAGGSRLHLVADRHGSVTELVDAEGAIAERYRYRDYGSEPWSDAATDPLTRNPYRYAGERTDRDGTQYLTERLYLPSIMRFASDDRAPEHNDYAYGHLNPITKIDPTGRTPEFDTIVGWVFAGLGAIATGISIGTAVFTGGGSISVLGIIGWATESASLAVGAATAANEFEPFLSRDALIGLNVAESVLGIASLVTAGFGTADWGERLDNAKGWWQRAAKYTNVTAQKWKSAAGDAELGRLVDDLRDLSEELQMKIAKLRPFDPMKPPVAITRALAPDESARLTTALAKLDAHWAAPGGGKTMRRKARLDGWKTQYDQSVAFSIGYLQRGNPLTRSIFWRREVAELQRLDVLRQQKYAGKGANHPNAIAAYEHLSRIDDLRTQLRHAFQQPQATTQSIIDVFDGWSIRVPDETGDLAH